MLFKEVELKGLKINYVDINNFLFSVFTKIFVQAFVFTIYIFFILPSRYNTVGSVLYEWMQGIWEMA